MTRATTGVSGSAVGRTLPALTAVQALVAMATFALSVLAPQLGLDVRQLGLLGSVLFAVGALSSWMAGWLIRRFGDLQLAALCMAAVLLAMLALGCNAAGLGAPQWALWPAVVLLGLAFGPETPASASVLARVTPPARRSLVFSVRQTGNQIGAMAGSLLLPMLLLRHAALPFVLVGALALAVALWCLRLVRSDGALSPALSASTASSAGVKRERTGGLRDVAASGALRLLTATMLVFMATQVCLNLFVMSHAVRHWQLAVPVAASLVALMQGAGLLGRLLWGWVAQKPGLRTPTLLGLLGLLMAAAGLPLFLWPGTPPWPVLAVLIALVGLSASGWNGVMMAEIARIAGPARAGAVTGAVLLFGYAGLAVAPLAFAALGARVGMGATFALLLAASGALAALLLHATRHPALHDKA
jgi:MFS family permease